MNEPRTDKFEKFQKSTEVVVGGIQPSYNPYYADIITYLSSLSMGIEVSKVSVLLQKALTAEKALFALRQIPQIENKSLRGLALVWGVSHETARQWIKNYSHLVKGGDRK